MRIFPCRFVLLENNNFCGYTTGHAFLWFCRNWTIPHCWAFRLFLALLHHMLLPGCICPRICAHISDSGLRTDFSDSESSENTSILNLKLIKCESSSNFMSMLVEPVGIPRLEQSRGWRRRTGLGIPLETCWFIYLGEGGKKRWLHLKHLCVFHSCQHKLWCNETTELPTGAWHENCELAREVVGPADSIPRKNTICSPLQHFHLECPYHAQSVPASTPSDWAINSPNPQSPWQLSRDSTGCNLECVERWFLSPMNNASFPGTKGNRRGETAYWERATLMPRHAAPCPCCPRPPAQGTGASQRCLKHQTPFPSLTPPSLLPLRKTVGLAHASNSRSYCVTLDEPPNLSD